MSDDLSDLYQEIILAHNRRPKNEGELDTCDYRAEGFNPLCGDKVTVFVRTAEENGKRINRVTFTGEGCAISRASASIMTAQVSNLTVAEADQRIEELTTLLTQAEEPDMNLEQVGDLAALAGVRKFPARIKCATLAWHTLQSALRGDHGSGTP